MTNQNPSNTEYANLRARLTDELIHPDLRNSFNNDLHEHQKETVNFLIMRYTEYIFQIDNPEIKIEGSGSKRLSGFIVAHEMGLGKTIMILFFLQCIVRCLQARRQPTRIIIVVYKTILQQWRKELRKWCKAIPVFIYHGDNKVRKAQLYAAAKERVCIILTTYALVSSDADKIIHILQAGSRQQHDPPSSSNSDSSPRTSSEDVVSDPNLYESSAVTDISPRTGADEADSFDNPGADDHTLTNAGTCIASSPSWLTHQSMNTNTNSFPSPHFFSYSNQNIMEPFLKSPKNMLLKPSPLSDTSNPVTEKKPAQSANPSQKNLLHDKLPLDNAIPMHCIDILILDEATAIKNPNTKTFKGLQVLDVGFKVALTGTPILNTPLELWTIVDFLYKGYLGNRAKFQRKIADPIAAGELKDANDAQRVEAQKARKALQKKLAPMMIRHTAIDLNRLPVNKIAFTFWLPLTEVQFVMYKAAFNMISDYNATEMVKNNSNDKVCLKFVHFLRKVCEHPCQLSEDDASLHSNDMRSCILELKRKATQSPAQVEEKDYINIVSKLNLQRNAPPYELERMDLDSYDGMHPESEQMQDDMQFTAQQANLFDGGIHQSPDHYDLTVTSITTLSSRFHLLLEIMQHIKKNSYKVIIFCEYRIIFNLIETLLSQNSISYLRLDGSINDPIERNQLCEKFNSDTKYTAFIVSIKLGAMGLNITGANRVIIFSPAWNLKVEEQAIARAYRLGQERNVVIYKLVCTNTIEEKIVIRQLQKAGIANVTLDDQKYQSVIGKSDVNSLFHFDRENRLTAHLPESIQQHATPQHVQSTIRKTLGDTLNDLQSEAAKELAFIERLTSEELCSDVSVLDYLYSTENIDEEADIAGAEHNQNPPLDFDQMVLSTPHTPTRQSLCHSNPRWRNLVFTHILSHYETPFLSVFTSVIAESVNETICLNTLIKEYRKKRQNDLIMQNKQFKREPSVPATSSITYFISQSKFILHSAWPCYVAKAALLMTLEEWNRSRIPDKIKSYNISLEILESGVPNTSDEDHQYLVQQFRSIISSFVALVNDILIPTEEDFQGFLHINMGYYESFLHHLATYRLKMLRADPKTFKMAAVFPTTFDLLNEECHQANLSLKNLAAEYDIEENWEELRKLPIWWLPTLRQNRKKVPLLWRCMEDIVATAQKNVLKKLITRQYGEVKLKLLDRCLVMSTSHQLDLGSGHARDQQDAELRSSLSEISDHFNRVIELMQSADISSRIDEQWRKLPQEVLDIIFKDTYQKLCKYNTNLPKTNRLLSSAIDHGLTTMVPTASATQQPLYFESEFTSHTRFPGSAEPQNAIASNLTLDANGPHGTEDCSDTDRSRTSGEKDDFIDILA